MLVLVTVSFASLILFVVYWVKKRYSLWSDMGALYETPVFPYGSLKGVKSNDHEGTTTEKFYWKHKGKGPFLGLFFAFEPVVLALDINFVKSVLISEFSRFQDRAFFINEKHEPITGHLGALKPPASKTVRAKLAPAFTMLKMKGMFPECRKIALKFSDKIFEMSTKNEDFDIKAVASGYTMDFIWSCVFGIDSKCLESTDNDFYRFGAQIFENPRHSTLVLLLHVALRNHAESLRLKIFRDEVSNFYTKIVKEILDFRISNNERREDLMDSLTEAYKNGDMTFNNVMAQAFGFFIAGYETSATTMSFCLFELARNPEIQEKTRSYIREILNKYNGELTFEAMTEMKYIDQLIYETLRMYSPLSNLTREATQDYKVPNTNFTIKKGTLVLIPAHAIHYDPEFYVNPKQFDPDRFSEENIKNRVPATFLSFGDGPRNCIGMKMGVTQAKLGIIAALQKSRFTISEKTKLPIRLQTKSFITCPIEKIWIKAEQIK